MTSNNKSTTLKANEPQRQIALMKTSLFTRIRYGILPMPYAIDIRSLALLRILLGLMQLFDVYSRVSNGKYDLAWYTSHTGRSYLYPSTDYSVGPIQSSEYFFLNVRREAYAEIAQFAVFTIMVLFFTVGYKCQNWWFCPSLWVMINSQICKSIPVTDGQDKLVLQILVWMCFLPVAEVWSIDAFFLRRRQRQEGVSENQQYQRVNYRHESVACLGLTLQVCMVYASCIMHRTFDNYSFAQLYESDWLWPDFPLVHYASNGSGTLKNAFVDTIRENATLNRFMTASGFCIEAFCPPLCFLFSQRSAHYFAINLVMLHFGTGLILNIPHWSYIGMLMHSIWIPTHVWDSLLAVEPTQINSNDMYKKTDGDGIKTNGTSNITNAVDKTKAQLFTRKHPTLVNPIFVVFPLAQKAASRVLRWAYLFLLLVTFCDEREWLVDWTNSTTEFAHSVLSFRNTWGMWKGATRYSPYTALVGWRKVEDEWENFDIFRFIKTGKEVEFEGFTTDYLEQSTYLYPSARWEKAIADEWETYLFTDDEHGVWHNMGVAMCNFINEDMAKLKLATINEVEIKVHIRGIAPPGSGTRYTNEIEDYRQSIRCGSGPFRSIDCEDEEEECQLWAEDGECATNKRYMLRACPISCNSCGK